MKFWERSCGCGEIHQRPEGEEVLLDGWAQRVRNLGGLLFMDLRDRSGLCQVIVDPKSTAYAEAEKVRTEFVVAVRGKIQRRKDTNADLLTGTHEVLASEIQILNEAKPPAIYVDREGGEDEVLRLKYRYLDLRRPWRRRFLEVRHRVIKVIRDFLDERGFLEIETSTMTRSTPEGARDFLIPSRLQAGTFYALPQSPQLFKQILMVAGIEKYFQVARCYRDEDLRRDRQLEFTQLDLETSFWSDHQIMDLTEELVCDIFGKVLNVRLQRPFPRLTYAEAMAKYGSDKPDLRYGLEIHDVTDAFTSTTFKIFAQGIAKGNSISAFLSPPANKPQDITKEFEKLGGRCIWLTFDQNWRFDGGNLSPNIAQLLIEGVKVAFPEAVAAGERRTVWLVMGSGITHLEQVGTLRLLVGRDLFPEPEPRYSSVWVHQFPLYKLDENKKATPAHHPFTRPYEEDLPLLDTEPMKVRAYLYDLALNGEEIAGGGLRIFNRALQEKVLEHAGYSKEDSRDRFGFFLDALEYGAPPHGGIAWGLDRLITILAGGESLRDVIAFPKTTTGQCPLTGAPAAVDPAQLRELKLKIEE